MVIKPTLLHINYTQFGFPKHGCNGWTIHGGNSFRAAIQVMLQTLKVRIAVARCTNGWNHVGPVENHEIELAIENGHL